MDILILNSSTMLIGQVICSRFNSTHRLQEDIRTLTQDLRVSDVFCRKEVCHIDGLTAQDSVLHDQWKIVEFARALSARCDWPAKQYAFV